MDRVASILSIKTPIIPPFPEGLCEDGLTCTADKALRNLGSSVHRFMHKSNWAAFENLHLTATRRTATLNVPSRLFAAFE